MSESENKSPGYSNPYKDTFLSPEDMNRVSLPSDEIDAFEEFQPFDMVWIWVILGVETLVVMIPLILTAQPFWFFFLMALMMAMTFTMMSAVKLQTRIDEEGIHYRMAPFHRKERMVRWEEMETVYVRKYFPVREDGGYGMRVRRKRMSYNVGSKHVIEIKRRDGKKILIGTQKPEEVALLLNKRLITV